MLRDADRSLANWLGRLLPPGVGVRFDTPGPQWTARPPEPLFVDAYLHDIGPDARGGQSGWSDLRDLDGRVVGRRQAARFFRLGYLITAWAAGPGRDGDADGLVVAEHEILGLVLNACAHYSILPADCLEGALAECGLTTVLECEPAGSPAGTLWAGLGVVPRAHLDLTLVAPALPPVLTDIAPPAREIVLNAGQEPATASAQAEHPFGTLRRWDKQTISEAGR